VSARKAAGEAPTGQGSGPVGFGSAWNRQPRRARTTAVPLSREQIVRAAIELADADGLDTLSLRRLGAKMGAGATSLYWHVANKEELLDLVLDEILGEVDVPAPSEDWRADLEAAARDLRRVLLAHRYTVVLMTTRPAWGPNALTRVEAILTTLARAGFSGERLFFAYSAVITYVTGEVTQEVAWTLATDAAKVDLEAATEGARTYIASLDATKYSTLLGLGDQLLSHDQDAQFTFGLTVVLDGLQAQLDS
jgi:AcrR family transcriptional regulator